MIAQPAQPAPGEPPRYRSRTHFQRRIDKLTGEVCAWRALAEKQHSLLERYREQLRKMRATK